MSFTISQLTSHFAKQGKVEWLGLRPARRVQMQVVNQVEADVSTGLIGDRYSGRTGSRHVSLIQSEHLQVISSLTALSSVSPELLRRNIVVSGINLLALKGRQFEIGDAILETTGLCHPCSRMEQELGKGGYNAVRGHGGITARVIKSGLIRLMDHIQPM